jgi:hypothetical protein
LVNPVLFIFERYEAPKFHTLYALLLPPVAIVLEPMSVFVHAVWSDVESVEVLACEVSTRANVQGFVFMFAVWYTLSEAALTVTPEPNDEVSTG